MVISVDIQDQAKLLAEGYLQGQRDLLISILEHRFSDPLPTDVLSQLATAPPDVIDTLGPLVTSAPDLASIVEAADVLAADA